MILYTVSYIHLQNNRHFLLLTLKSTWPKYFMVWAMSRCSFISKSFQDFLVHKNGARIEPAILGSSGKLLLMESLQLSMTSVHPMVMKT